MFEAVQTAPPDAILGLTDAFKKDTNPGKINLGVGVYKDADGNTPVLASVKEAEARLLKDEATKGYLPIDGLPEYDALVQELLFGKGHEAITSNRAATAQTPGGTGALRVAGDFIAKNLGDRTVWLSDPTWANHQAVFTAAGLKTATYRYFNPATSGVNIDAMLEDIRKMPAGDVVLLHGCCHNPTGADPTLEEWDEIAKAVREAGVLPLVDFAYQGFGDGLREDASGWLRLVDADTEALVCSSFSKNFGLYRERTGALTVLAKSEAASETAMSQIKRCIRSNYSNPPAHGGQIVHVILADPELRKKWDAELTEMRDRINTMRKLFVETLAAKGVEKDMSFIARQRGMFSYSGLNNNQVARLRDEFAIYIVGSGRINVAGMTKANMEPLCEAIAKVM